ncbi:S8 family serine peptidase [Nocardioides euryhalodurans]|uniref:Uncharacterized protein n=1 Tax=Nocardioides euryhalodurans TaxID=2518370 RepID=A0A4P7GNH9_9ACTN|nr:S8 family serine peptidase [Nocardioides euryhalodurans]QBR93509.1 hypothetical protein EXE57_15450 [Nocardioides euryhalodurans]
MGQVGNVVRRMRRGGRAVLGATVLALAGAALVPTAHADDAPRDPQLHLVTFAGPGTAGYDGPRSRASFRAELTRRQDAALRRIGSPTPAYRWTTALSGFAVRLTPAQADDLRALPHVADVEENSVRPLAATGAALAARADVPGGRGGAGVVVGVVDSGIWPEGPIFAPGPGLGDAASGFDGTCQPGEEWEPAACSGKLAAASWFVEGFGREHVSSTEVLSPRDVLGHGTQVASVAVGNARVSTGVAGLPANYSGTAPRARLASYKACWSAPNPSDDGCATADLVAAVDRAVEEGVDVLNLSVSGSDGTGAVDRALLGAAEAGIVVVAAAGNDAEHAYAAPETPWVTTVGGLAGTGAAGSVRLAGGPRLAGAMTVRRSVDAPVVLASAVPAPGSTRDEAARCVPGALDASRTAGAVVVCQRGEVARIAKSTAVARADGVGMVLVNTAPGSVAYDLHDVPTVHLDEAAGDRLVQWVRRQDDPRVGLDPTDGRVGPVRVAGWSAGGDPLGSFVKPDLVAPATGILAATAPGPSGDRWAFLNGTSAAAARTSGLAATLLARHDWSAPVVRSVLATSARPLPAGALRSGSGRARPEVAMRTRLAYDTDPAAYRGWLRGARADVNSASIALHGGDTRATRTITNLDDEARYWSVEADGFGRHDVEVAPAAVRLGPGESATYTVRVQGPARRGVDDGTITWRGPDGVRVRIPVVISR